MIQNNSTINSIQDFANNVKIINFTKENRETTFKVDFGDQNLKYYQNNPIYVNPPENKTIEFVYTHADSNNTTATYRVQRLPDDNGTKKYSVTYTDSNNKTNVVYKTNVVSNNIFHYSDSTINRRVSFVFGGVTSFTPPLSSVTPTSTNQSIKARKHCPHIVRPPLYVQDKSSRLEHLKAAHIVCFRNNSTS